MTDSHGEFALALFAGLITFNVFSESILSSPNLIVSNPNYVKKVVFPLEILPVSTLGAAVINSGFSLLILPVGELLVIGRLPWTLLFLPLMYLPLFCLCLGLSWFLASLGVFIWDIPPAGGGDIVLFNAYLLPDFGHSRTVSPGDLSQPVNLYCQSFPASGPIWTNAGLG